jgi:glycosyltransferase involved in cell wall biosynthesis
MSPNFYLVSLYYDKNRVTGANKRFDEIGKCLTKSGQWNFLVFVTEGNEPDWCPRERVRCIRPYHSKATRLLSWLHLSWMLLRTPSGIVYSDFQPVPIGVDWVHKRFQLIHDLRNWTGFGRGGLGRLTQAFQQRQLASAKAVVTVSEFTADDIEEKCGIARDRILVSYNGVNPTYQALSELDRTSASCEILYIATFESRKNHLRLIQALELMRSPCRVTLVGRDLGHRQAVETYIRNSSKLAHVDIQIIEAMDEDALLRLYQTTRLFVSPSLFEGFGMPLIEAAACGVPVVCSDIKVFREIMGEDAYYFDPENIENIAATLETALESTEPKRKNIERFRWTSITERLFSEMTARTLRSPETVNN